MHDDEFVGIDWDAGNLGKCTKQGVTIEEIENVDLPANVSVPTALMGQVEARARREGVTSDAFIRDAIEKALRSAA